MILQAFATELQKQKNVNPCDFLQKWLVKILLKTPENNVENIIHTELTLQETPTGSSIVSTSSKSGQRLLNSLYNFCLSYENFLFARWLHLKKSTDFKK